MVVQAQVILTAVATWYRAQGKGRALGRLAAFLLVLGGLIGTRVFVAVSQTATDPGQPGPCSVITQTVTISSTIQTNIYYPGTDQCGLGLGAPYPAIVFAHGFGMFGLSNGATDNAGNGRHLASWGYVAAIPKLSDDAETRVAETLAALNYVAAQAGTPGSFLYQKVDVTRLATAGHSLGGATALAIAARDARVKAVVVLDPVYHSSDSSGQEGPPVWNPQAEAPNITVPTGILGAPPNSCNAQADYADIYPLVGAIHKASFLLNGVSHCVFADPGSFFCSFVCGGATGVDKTRLSQKYMTAWLNYYLHFNAGYYGYLYGAQADADVANGLVARQAQTAPRGLSAAAATGAINLTWQVYAHPVVAGYNVYRRLPGQSYSETPYAHLGVLGAYADTSLVGGQVYSYTVRSYDAAGNLHQASSEVSAVAPSNGVSTPTATATATRTPTATATPTATRTPFVPTAWAYLPLVLKQ
jgi:dienelactone hydrolase